MMRFVGHILVVTACLSLNPGSTRAAVLRVCADPNNMPFSDSNGAGFENRIVTRVARDLGATVVYTWWAQRRGFVRNTLKANVCDIWPGVASGAPALAASRPYYRSTYVFATRADRNLHIASLADPQLRHLAIGVQMIGDDAANTPPAHALARQGIVGNIHGYMVGGDYRDANPGVAIIEAVASGDIDVALVWGPMAGYFAARDARLKTAPVPPWREGPDLPMSFDISMGVRFGDNALLQHIDNSLQKNKAEIALILASYHVPVVPEPFATPGDATP